MQRFCEKEARKLNKLKYILFDVDDTVTNGGKLLVVTDFTTDTPRLDAILESCGMTHQAGLLIENDANHYPYGYPQTYLLPKLVGNDITAGVSQNMMIYTPIAQGITTNDDSEFAFTDLLTTGDNAYSMENYATAETAQKAGDQHTCPAHLEYVYAYAVGCLRMLAAGHEPEAELGLV